MSAERYSKKQVSDLTASMTAERHSKKQASDLTSSMTAERHSKKQSSNSSSGMSEERHSKKQASDLTASMTAERLLKKQANKKTNKKKNISVSVNDDAKIFLDAYNDRTQLEICGVCATEEEPRHLSLLSDLDDLFLQNSDLPHFKAHIMRLLSTKGPGHMSAPAAYMESIESEFDDLGWLRGCSYICNTCKKVLKKGRSKQSPIEIESEIEDDNSSRSDDDLADVLGSDGDTSNASVESKPLCAETFKRWNVPEFAYLRGLYPGLIPHVLKGLTLVEESMIAIYNPITRIKLEGKRYYHGLANTYSVINNLTKIASTLPFMPTVSSFALMKYRNEKSEKEFKYRPKRVKNALDWLKENNHLYKDVKLVYPSDWDHSSDKRVTIEHLEIDSSEHSILSNAERDTGW
jgi:hypothetical protein